MAIWLPSGLKIIIIPPTIHNMLKTVTGVKWCPGRDSPIMIMGRHIYALVLVDTCIETGVFFANPNCAIAKDTVEKTKLKRKNSQPSGIDGNKPGTPP